MGHHFATADNSMRAPVVQRSNSHHGAGMDSSPHVPAGYTPGPSPNQAMLRSQVSTPSFSTAQRDQFLAQSAPSSQFSTGTFDTGQFVRIFLCFWKFFQKKKNRIIIIF